MVNLDLHFFFASTTLIWFSVINSKSILVVCFVNLRCFVGLVDLTKINYKLPHGFGI